MPGESEIRKGEPSAERERLRRGLFVARVNACPSGSFPDRSHYSLWNAEEWE